LKQKGVPRAAAGESAEKKQATRLSVSVCAAIVARRHDGEQRFEVAPER
jgi:hypothetical protein